MAVFNTISLTICQWLSFFGHPVSNRYEVCILRGSNISHSLQKSNIAVNTGHEPTFSMRYVCVVLAGHKTVYAVALV